MIGMSRPPAIPAKAGISWQRSARKEIPGLILRSARARVSKERE